MHDARVLRNTPVYLEIELNPANLFPGNIHILEDAAYPLKTWLLTPFRDNGRLTPQQRRYNVAHSATRMVVERCFGLSKGGFSKTQNVNGHRQTRGHP